VGAIGHLPDMLADHSLVVPMRRRAADGAPAEQERRQFAPSFG